MHSLKLPSGRQRRNRKCVTSGVKGNGRGEMDAMIRYIFGRRKLNRDAGISSLKGDT